MLSPEFYRLYDAAKGALKLAESDANRYTLAFTMMTCARNKQILLGASDKIEVEVDRAVEDLTEILGEEMSKELLNKMEEARQFAAKAKHEPRPTPAKKS